MNGGINNELFYNRPKVAKKLHCKLEKVRLTHQFQK